MTSLDELVAELQALPWQKRQAINEALYEGRAVADHDLATLAAEWAHDRRRWTLRLYLGVMGPLLVLTNASLLWLLVRNDPEFSVGAAAFIGLFTAGLFALIIWAIAWRPLVRAEKANLAKVGLGRPPSYRESAHWVIAWIGAWPVAALLGAGFRALGVTLGPFSFLVWFGVVWAIKRMLDSTLDG